MAEAYVLEPGDIDMKIRRSGERGYADHGWLKTFHTFSFAEYYDPAYMGFRALRVINDDRVAPKQGFGTHPHLDMEIITYVLEGELEHKDSMGTGSIIRPGEVQRMTAGTGVTHSEVNPADQELHLLQIWILPEKRNLTPSYEQKAFSAEERHGKLRLVASRDGREGSVTVHQDVNLYATMLGVGEHVAHEVRPLRNAWIHVAKGSVALNGTQLQGGDGAAVVEPGIIQMLAEANAEILVFDVA